MHDDSEMFMSRPKRHKAISVGNKFIPWKSKYRLSVFFTTLFRGVACQFEGVVPST